MKSEEETMTSTEIVEQLKDKECGYETVIHLNHKTEFEQLARIGDKLNRAVDGSEKSYTLVPQGESSCLVRVNDWASAVPIH